MKPLLIALGLAALVSSARADVYGDVEKLCKERGATETSADARTRWRDAQAKLEAIAPALLPDYRHCLLLSVLAFRLEGPEAAAQRRYQCTEQLVQGTVSGGAVTASSAKRAGMINQLSRMAEQAYQAQVKQLSQQLVEVRTKITFGIAKSQIELLRKAGKIDAREAGVLTRALERASWADTAAAITPAPFGIPLDEARLFEYVQQSQGEL